MPQRRGWRTWLQDIQTVHWLWGLGVSSLISTAVGGLVGAWTNFGWPWQVLSALFTFAVILGIVLNATVWLLSRRRVRRLRGLVDSVTTLARQISEVVADAKRAEPPPAVTRIPYRASMKRIEEEMQRGAGERNRLEAQTIAKIQDRFGVDLAGRIAEMQQLGIITDEDRRSFYWNLNSIHTLDALPQTLAAWAAKMKQERGVD